MSQGEKIGTKKLNEEIMNFAQHIAGSSRIVAACLFGDYSRLMTPGTVAQVLLVVKDFQPRLMNYVKTMDSSSLFVLSVDKWVFERDVDRGLLGEGLAGGLVFPYKPIVNASYLKLQEVALKRRLIVELLQNLILKYPELSYELHIEPKYFMYQAWLTRARLFPPILDSVSRSVKREEDLQRSLDGFLFALKELEKDGTLAVSGKYLKISKNFVRKTARGKVRFKSLLKTGNRALFGSLIGILPQMINSVTQGNPSAFNFQKILRDAMRPAAPIEDPDNFVFVKTSTGLVSLANRVDIQGFARKILKANDETVIKLSSLGGVLNDVYLVTACVGGKEKKVVVKRFRDWSNFKWFPLSLWSIGTRSFAVLGNSRLEREYAINRLLHSEGFKVPELFYVSPNERLVFMEYVAGEDLSNTIKRIADTENTGELNRDLDLISKVGGLLAKVHALSVSIGDSKPENIIINPKGELYLTDLEQAARNGDRTWDIAEFLYFSGHYFSPLTDSHRVEMMAKSFISGYLQAGGNAKLVKKAGNAKYTKVFSVFTFPNIMRTISNTCRKL